jgi:hypothetical protein
MHTAQSALLKQFLYLGTWSQKCKSIFVKPVDMSTIPQSAIQTQVLNLALPLALCQMIGFVPNVEPQSLTLSQKMQQQQMFH